MSLNIQTADGLLEIGGNITKEKVIFALGYSPADEEDLPNIIEDDSGELAIADPSNNVIMTVNADGIHTTEIVANGIALGETVSGHTSNSSVHVSSSDRSKWNNKSDFSGDYNDLTNAPDIKEDGTGELFYTDSSGNVIAKINSNGFETTKVIANTILANGTDVAEQIGLKADQASLDTHINNKSNPHNVTKSQVGLGNVNNTADVDKPVSNAQQEALDSLKNELSESIVSESKEWTIVDNSGNIIAKVDSSGLETIAVTVESAVVNGRDVEDELDNKVNKVSGKGLSTNDFTTVYKNKLDGIAEGANNYTYTLPVATSSVLGGVKSGTDITIDSSGNVSVNDDSHNHVISNIDGLQSALDNKATQSSLTSHTSNTTAHITATERSQWNAKSNFSGDYYDLTNAPDIREDGSGDLVIADPSGKIVFRSDGNGFETTTLTAQIISLAGNDVGAAINNKVDKVTGKGLSTNDFTTTYKNKLDGVCTNLVNGSAVGSLRSVNSTEESSTYTMGQYAFAVGYKTTASDWGCHAEGTGTIASLSDSHAEGYYTTASGVGSHAEGLYTTASGSYSHAEGCRTTASGVYSHAEGHGTTANAYQQKASGCYNVLDTDGFTGTTFSATSDAYIIGNGTSSSQLSNAFRVVFDGRVYGGTYNSSGADYAEFFEWADGNPNNEDRIGHFVTLAEEGAIKIASTNDEILGVISGNGSVVGDAYDDVWQGMWMRDIYGRILYEDVEVEQENEKGEKSIVIEHRMKLNPDYDPSQPYIPRSQRPEWDVVGLLGKLVLIDDGTCIAGGYCACNDSGIATASKAGYKVLNRLDETHVKVLIK